MTSWVWLFVGIVLAALVYGVVRWRRRVQGAGAAAAPMDRLLNQNRDVLGDSFTLNLGSHYRVLTNRPPLQNGSVVIYRGPRQIPADRGWDYFHAFETLDAQQLLLPLERCPRSVADSLLLFADVPQDAERQWRNPSLMRGLFHRAKRVRERTAAGVGTATIGLDYAIPRLFDLAIETGGDNAFLQALNRIRSQALPIIEALDEKLPDESRVESERILAYLGSKRYVARYRDALLSDDPMEIRRAAKRLSEIGDRLAEPRLQELMQHQNMNVRFAARDALAKLAESE